MLIMLLCFMLSTFLLNGQNASINKYANLRRLQPIDSLQKLGYLNAAYKNTETDTTITKGALYHWADINVVAEDNKDLFLGLSELSGKAANQFYLKQKVQEKLAKMAYNDGYPFAEVSLQIDSIYKQKVDITVIVTFKNYITYDSLSQDNSFIKTKYLQNYLSLNYGSAWSTKVFKAIEERIDQLSFVRLTEKPGLAFSRGKAQISLQTANVAANQFDAIVGIIPQDGRTVITGQADLKLPNLFKSATAWELNWQRYNEGSQLLNTSLSQVKSFNTDLGYELDFNLLKEDSTFLKIAYAALVNYTWGSSWALTTGFSRITNQVTAEQEVLLSNANDKFRSSVINSLQLSLYYKNPITYPQLKNAYSAVGSVEVGAKTILNYDSLPEVLQQVPRESTNVKALIQLEAQQKVFDRFTFEQTLTLNALFNNALARNDLLRLGGLQSFRGFNQNFFFTENYAALSLDFRYFLNNESTVFALTDLAVLDEANRFIYSVGLGLDTRVKSGWFRLIYALGQENDQKLNFSLAKVHFGYIALF